MHESVRRARGRSRVGAALVSGALLAAALVACGGDERQAGPAPEASSAEHGAGQHATDDHEARTAAPAARPLRPAERRTTLAMPTSYRPSPPTGVGTDDYRCFLLDPGLDQDAWLTGTEISPGNPEIVHHVILFRVDGALADAAQAEDDLTPDPGWTCFGGMGLEGELGNLDDASWLGAWAPGGGETVLRPGYGVALEQGTRIVMQVHYSLLLQDEAARAGLEDLSATRIRWRPQAGSDLEALHTVLLPAPVELPCRPEHAGGPLCTHDASVADVKARFGESAGQTANLLHLLCGTEVRPSATMSCTRTVPRAMTILGAAGHMHLLGRWLRIEANSGTPRATEVLDIPLWDFDDQAARPIRPLRVEAGDTLTVTCHHDQRARDLLPAFEGTEEKYVVWGEGSGDEMCLGILQAVFDD